MENRERPTGVTVAAVLMALFALNGIQSFMGPGDQLFIERLVGASANDMVNVAYRLAYTACAALTAIGLWQMKSWALRAYTAWAVLLVSGHVIETAIFKLQGETDLAWWQVAVPLVLLAIVLTLIGLAIKRSLKRAA